MNKTKKETSSAANAGNSLRRSGVDFPFDKDTPLVKNHKVNA